MSQSEEKPKKLIDKIDLVSLMKVGRRKKRRDPHYATFNRRMMAITIDSFFLILLEPFFRHVAPIHQEALQSIHIEQNDPHTGMHIIQQVLTNQEFINSWFVNLTLQMFVFCIFSGICWHFWATTPGKTIMRIKIVDAATEQPITDRQILIRLLGYWPSCFCFMLGIFWIGLNKKKRGWHDFMAHTTVITLPWKIKKAPKAASSTPQDQNQEHSV